MIYLLAVSSYMFIDKTLRLNNLKNRADMNAKNSVLVISVEGVIYLLFICYY